MKVPTLLMIVPAHFSKYRMAVITNVPIVLFQEHEEFPRSDSLENIIKQALEITKRGIKEIVLTGVNIGDYGKGEFGNKKHENTFLDLIVALDKIDALKRIRISSIEPNLLTDKVIDFVSQSSRAFVPHFHLPLQSGNDEVLKK